MKFLQKINGLIYKLFKAPYYKLRLASFGNNSKILKPTGIDNPKRIYIGNNVLISYWGWLAATPHTGDENCKLIIGDGTYIGRFCHIYATSLIEIERKVIIADKVYISDNLHGYKNIDLPVIDQPIEQTKTVTIGEGTWLGENVCVVGASVGKHCVIGANAVVTKNIPDHCIAIGIPAKIIKRYNFTTGDWQKTNESGEFI
jgi:acetyltransferase-like isoleucine patch superfamily enzyme